VATIRHGTELQSSFANTELKRDEVRLIRFGIERSRWRGNLGGIAIAASCLRGSRVFEAQPFRQEYFQWLRSALFAAA